MWNQIQSIGNFGVKTQYSVDIFADTEILRENKLGKML